MILAVQINVPIMEPSNNANSHPLEAKTPTHGPSVPGFAANSAAITRTVSPHVRREFTRNVGGVDVPVRRTIINAEAARIQRGLKALLREMELSRPLTGSGPGLATSQFNPGSLQLDLFEEARRLLRRRADQILDERLTRYARLTLGQAAHLAMANVRFAVAKVASDGGGMTRESLAEMETDLMRLNELLFAESLARLDPADIAAVREACAERYAERHTDSGLHVSSNLQVTNDKEPEENDSDVGYQRERVNG